MATTATFTLLNDIRNNLDFLYEYCGIAASGCAFGMSDKEIIELIEDDLANPELYSEAMGDGSIVSKYVNSNEYGSDPSIIIKTTGESEIETITFFPLKVEVNKDEVLQEKGIKITSQTLSELRIFYLADLVLKFIENNELNLLDRVLKSSDYCHEVLSVSHALVVIPEEKRQEAEKKRQSDTNRKNASKYRLKIDGTDECANSAAYELFMRWNEKPEMYKNAARFKADVVAKEYCKNESTAQKWLVNFKETTQLSEGLKAKLKK